MIPRILTRHLTAILVSVALAGVGTAALAVTRWLAAREEAAVEADRLLRLIDDLRAENDARAEAAAVARAHADRLRRELARRDDTLRALQQIGGLDAPLPDPLRDAAGILWPR